jgi:hypothetical protein
VLIAALFQPVKPLQTICIEIAASLSLFSGQAAYRPASFDVWVKRFTVRRPEKNLIAGNSCPPLNRVLNCQALKGG